MPNGRMLILEYSIWSILQHYLNLHVICYISFSQLIRFFVFGIGLDKQDRDPRERLTRFRLSDIIFSNPMVLSADWGLDPCSI